VGKNPGKALVTQLEDLYHVPARETLPGGELATLGIFLRHKMALVSILPSLCLTTTPTTSSAASRRRRELPELQEAGQMCRYLNGLPSGVA